MSCAAGVVANYPAHGKVTLKLPPAQTTMPNPCVGVPANPWCPKPKHKHHKNPSPGIY